jgi:hypothetical protein
MSKLNDGEVQITLGDETILLKPTLEAAMAISSMSGGFQGALKACSNQDLAAQAAIIQAGSGNDDKDFVKTLRKRVFLAGTLKLTPLLNDYILMLMNGGKPLGEPTEEQDDAGNAPG